MRLISDFFMQLDFYFGCMSSSMVNADLKVHYQYFKPDALVYCMKTENRDDMVSVLLFVENVLKPDNIPFIVISDKSDYNYLCRQPGGAVGADLQIGAAETVTSIQEKIAAYLISGKKSGIGEMVKGEAAGGGALTGFDAALENLNRLEQALEAPADEFASLLSLPERQRILIIDDSTMIHKAVKSYLGRDYDISSAISGTAALRFLKTKEVNLILLDYDMPEMDGPEVLIKLRENPMTAHIPVIFLTGINDAAKIQKALALKPEGYLLKPIDKNILLNKIKEVLGEVEMV